MRKRGQKGFTLVELMVVMAILAVLTAIVFPAVTGTTAVSRETAQAQDVSAVQTGVDRFNADDDTSAWPTEGALLGATTPWNAGYRPTGTGPTGSGTDVDPYIFTQDDVAGVNWDAQTSEGDDFFPDYVRNKPPHTGDTEDTVPVGTGVTYPDLADDPIAMKRGGDTVYARLNNTTGGALDFPLWAVDKDGTVWVFVDVASY